MTTTRKRKPGPKPIGITWRQVAALRARPGRLTWEEVAAKLGCSRATVIRVWNKGAKTR